MQANWGKPRQAAFQVLNFLVVVSSALMIWKALSLYFNTESPIVVVLSESMEPLFARGDLLFLSLPEDERLEIGDVPVFKLRGRDIPIVHRALVIHDDAKTGKQYILTKGDNNNVDDRGLYNPGQLWVHKDDLMGIVRGYMPYVGMMTIWMNDYPMLKVALLAAMALFVLINRE